MRFNVAQLLKEPVGSTREYDIEEDATVFGPDSPAVGAVTGIARLIRTPSGILARAKLNATAKLECSRCLTDFTMPIEYELEEEYHPLVDINTGLPVRESDTDLRITENHMLDLSEAGRQYALLNLPMQPLCSELCQGLCPECGEDRNRGHCTCASTSGDNKLAAGLRQWLEQSEGRAG